MPGAGPVGSDKVSRANSIDNKQEQQSKWWVKKGQCRELNSLPKATLTNYLAVLWLGGRSCSGSCWFQISCISTLPCGSTENSLWLGWLEYLTIWQQSSSDTAWYRGPGWQETWTQWCTRPYALPSVAPSGWMPSSCHTNILICDLLCDLISKFLILNLFISALVPLAERTERTVYGWSRWQFRKT
jgi:hypothetical protein